MNRYYKNMILCGEIDYYCLLCEESFELAEQVERHIRWEQHRKNIKNLSYIPKYKKDCIFMIGKYYYCEICNYVTTSAAVNNHINDYTHLFRKKNPITTKKASEVTRNKNGLIKYHNMIMSKLEWHGIVNNHCFLCNTSVENVEHVKQRDHMIALVQSEMRKVKDNEYNRKIDDYTLYCFTCNKSFEIGLLHNHERNEKDQNIKSKIIESSASAESMSVKSTPAAEKVKVESCDKDLSTPLLEKQRKYFYIMPDNCTARCIQCKRKLYNFTLEALISHRKAHNTENKENDSSDDSDSFEYTEIIDHGKRRSEIAKYGKKHFIKLNPGGSKGYCSLCDVYISAHYYVAKEHVRGTRHQGMLLAKGLKKGLRYDNQTWYIPPMKSLQIFLKEAFIVEDLKVICLNNKICVDIQSFLLVIPIANNKIKCLTCDKIIQAQENKQHCGSNAHKKNLGRASVLDIDYDPELGNEFVREVRPDLYHCGFCNQMIPYWDPTHFHLKSRKHIMAKKSKEVMCSLAQKYFNKTSIYVCSKKSHTLLQKLSGLGLF